MQRLSILSLFFTTAVIGCDTSGIPKTAPVVSSPSTPMGSGEMPSVRDLIANGASPHDIVDQHYGLTRVHLAARQGNAGDLKFLLENGGDANVQDRSGKGTHNYKTPLHWATTAEVVDVLLDGGADISAPGPAGQQPIASIAFRNRGSALKRLAERGGDINARDSFGGFTVLIWACAGFGSGFPDDPPFGDEDERLEIVKYLIAEGAAIDAQDDDGQSALHYAAKFNAPLVRVLLDLGADATIKDNSDKTPLDWANELEQQECARLLSTATR